MKLNKLLLSLSLAGLTFSQVGAQEPSASRRIGDDATTESQVRSIRGDESAVRLASSSRVISDSGTGNKHRTLSDSRVGFAEALDMGILAPTTTASCSTGCADACTTLSCDTGGAGGVLGNKNIWASGEVLLWFTEAMPAPTVVTTANQGIQPVLGNAGVQSAFGGPDGIDNGLIPGFRAEIGMWLDDCQKIGLTGRAFGFTEYEDYQATSDGTTSIGIPFFNVDPNVVAEDAYLVAYDLPNGDPVSSGSVWARSDLDLIGTEGSARILLTEGSNSRFDLIGGYTFNRITSSMSLRSQSTNEFTGDLIQDGTVFDTLDLFATENVFHGGHLGLLSSVTRKGLTISSLGKISFGNMRSSGVIDGFTHQSFGGTTTSTAGGILTRPSNIGSLVAENNFSFISELGMKMGFNLNENMRATVGYTLMYWSSVAMAGDQIDRLVDASGTVMRPEANLITDGFWAQGLDLGFIYNY